MESTDPVELAVFPDYAEAIMIQELLKNNGIETILRGEADPIGVASGAAPSTLLVAKEDLERARTIYEDFYAGPPDENDDADKEKAGPSQ